MSRGYYPDKDLDFNLTDEEKQALAELNKKQLETTKQKLAYTRELLRKKEIIAERLEDLRSKDGTLFLRETPGKYISAKAFDPSINWRLQETAYLCHCQFIPIGEDPNSCGWVKGEPRREEYNEIGLLCGSAGYRYYCRVCNQLIGEVQTRIS